MYCRSFSFIIFIRNFHRLERLTQNTQANGYSSDDHMNLKRPKRSQVLPYGQENEHRPYYQDKRFIALEERRGNRIGTEFAPVDNGDRYNLKKAGRLIRDSMR